MGWDKPQTFMRFHAFFSLDQDDPVFRIPSPLLHTFALPLRKRYLSINFRNQNLRCFYWNKNAQWGKSPFTVAFNFCLQLHFRKSIL